MNRGQTMVSISITSSAWSSSVLLIYFSLWPERWTPWTSNYQLAKVPCSRLLPSVSKFLPGGPGPPPVRHHAGDVERTWPILRWASTRGPGDRRSPRLVDAGGRRPGWNASQRLWCQRTWTTMESRIYRDSVEDPGGQTGSIHEHGYGL